MNHFATSRSILLDSQTFFNGSSREPKLGCCTDVVFANKTARYVRFVDKAKWNAPTYRMECAARFLKAKIYCLWDGTSCLSCFNRNSGDIKVNQKKKRLMRLFEYVCLLFDDLEVRGMLRK